MMTMISASSLQTVRNESLLLTPPACGAVTAAPAKEYTSFKYSGLFLEVHRPLPCPAINLALLPRWPTAWQ